MRTHRHDPHPPLGDRREYDTNRSVTLAAAHDQAAGIAIADLDVV
jgi:hypothetical protein